jgi:hypothetical protein
VVALRQQIELVGQRVAVEHATHIPAHAFLNHLRCHAQPVQHLQGPFGVAERAGANRHGVVVIQHHALNATGRKIQSRRKPHRPRTYHHRLMTRRHAQTLLIALPIGENGELVGL